MATRGPARLADHSKPGKSGNSQPALLRDASFLFSVRCPPCSSIYDPSCFHTHCPDFLEGGSSCSVTQGPGVVYSATQSEGHSAPLSSPSAPPPEEKPVRDRKRSSSAGVGSWTFLSPESESPRIGVGPAFQTRSPQQCTPKVGNLWTRTQQVALTCGRW